MGFAIHHCDGPRIHVFVRRQFRNQTVKLFEIVESIRLPERINNNGMSLALRRFFRRPTQLRRRSAFARHAGFHERILSGELRSAKLIKVEYDRSLSYAAFNALARECGIRSR